MEQLKPRYLILADGSVFAGTAFGADRTQLGEVVFTTGMTGYQEAITDQSYAHQILVFTNPLIGNYGVNLASNESLQPQCSGVVVRQVARVVGNAQSQLSLPEFLQQYNIPGLAGIDTRALVKKLRDHGTINGMLVDDLATKDEVVQKLQTAQPTAGIVKQVATSKPYPNPGLGANIVMIDYGAKHSILAELARRDCNVTVLPPTATAEEVLRMHPDGVLLSNGPGDPTELPETLKMIQVVQTKVPLMGICLGHQLFALANGAKTYKMKFGHRGFNHPVKEIATNQINFTSQNHGYAVDRDSLKDTDLIVTHEEINDHCVEGIRHRHYPAFSVQFHPDAAPGPHDAVAIFDDFLAAVKQRKEQNNA